MLSFAFPWAALLLPLPLLVLALPPVAETLPAIRVPFFAQVRALTGASVTSGAAVATRSHAQTALLVLLWLLAIAALARPQWALPPMHQDRPARDLLLLVDLSGSMATEDFSSPDGKRIDRLAATKAVLDDFLARRTGDRVGVVVFGNAPFTLAPFTTDLQLARSLVQEMQVGVAGPKTAFGDAIGLGINLFDKSTVPARTMIALTDGNDTGSGVPPAQGARIARDRGITIHTVAVGDPAAAGEEKLDEATLQDVASTTGGIYRRAMDRDGLSAIYSDLDALETRKVDSISFQPKRELYWMPVAALLLSSMLAQALPLLVRRRAAVAPVRP